MGNSQKEKGRKNSQGRGNQIPPGEVFVDAKSKIRKRTTALRQKAQQSQEVCKSELQRSNHSVSSNGSDGGGTWRKRYRKARKHLFARFRKKKQMAKRKAAKGNEPRLEVEPTENTESDDVDPFVLTMEDNNKDAKKNAGVLTLFTKRQGRKQELARALEYDTDTDSVMSTKSMSMLESQERNMAALGWPGKPRRAYQYFPPAESALGLSETEAGCEPVWTDTEEYRREKEGSRKLKSRQNRQRKKLLGSGGYTSTETASAVVIQTAYRGYTRRRDFKRLIAEWKAATKIQAAYRGYAKWAEYELLVAAPFSIQVAYRSCVAQEQYLDLLEKWVAATMIQAAFRGYHRRSVFETAVFDIGFDAQAKNLADTPRRSSRRGSETTGLVMAVSYSELEEIERQQHADSLSLTKAVEEGGQRDRMVGDWQLGERQVKRVAATVTQSAYRGYAQRRDFKRLVVESAAAVKIQSAFRMYSKWSEYELLKAAPLDIQQAYRGYVEQEQHLDDLEKNVAATMIQAAIRGYLQRTALGIVCQHKPKTMCTVEADFYPERRYTSQFSWAAASLIQAVYRGYSQRTEYELLKNAPLDIRTAYWGYVEQEQYLDNLEKMVAATMIQAAFRGFLQRAVLEV